jgi:hypothetical protein
VFFTREGVINVHKSHISARDAPHGIRERGFHVRFSVSVWAGIVGDTIVGPRLLPGNDIVTLKLFYRAPLKYEPPAARHRLWFQRDGTRAHCVEGVQQWLKATRKVEWVDCISSFVAGINSYVFFLWEHLKKPTITLLDWQDFLICWVHVIRLKSNVLVGIHHQPWYIDVLSNLVCSVRSCK